MLQFIVVGYACLELILFQFLPGVDIVVHVVDDMRLCEVQEGFIEDGMDEERTVIKFPSCPSFKVNVV